MDETFAFSKQYEYDTLKIAVTVPVTLRLNGDTVDFEAKVDTGAENCIFEKIHGERLGLVIELGREQNFSTPTGTFTTYGHELTIDVLEIEFVSTVYSPKKNLSRAMFPAGKAGSTA